MVGNIPVVGEFYHFFDDGKHSSSRHYICKYERIVTPEEAKNILVTVPGENCTKDSPEFYDISLYDHWHDNQMPLHDWLYASETDYFIEVSCPTYDDNNLWFIRTKDGGWFSMDIQSWWQSGRLDIDGKIYDAIIQDYLDNNWDISGYTNAKYEKK